ncbi:MAG: amine oxidase [Actinobacteria bacterium]|nr:MAG: amine oxidase [Actinomycetota bacterium]
MPEETKRQRWQRNFHDLLQELRVAQTGVQILFAFLLTLPFSTGFSESSDFQRNVYIVALLTAAAAAALIISPVAFHRALFRSGRKPELTRYAHRMATGGLAFLLIAMVAAVLLVTDFMFSRTTALVITSVTGIWFLFFWLVLPVARRFDGADPADQEADTEEPDPRR